MVHGEPTNPNLAIVSPTSSPTACKPSAAQGACFLALNFIQSSTSSRLNSLILMPPPYSTSYPSDGNGVSMSLKMIAASIFWYLSIGLPSYGFTKVHVHAPFPKLCSAAIFRYSGRWRPAWRMNQTECGLQVDDSMRKLFFVFRSMSHLQLSQHFIKCFDHAKDVLFTMHCGYETNFIG